VLGRASVVAGGVQATKARGDRGRGPVLLCKRWRRCVVGCVNNKKGHCGNAL
jgi:hypothetical protein